MFAGAEDGRYRRAPALVLALVVALVLAGCGGDGDGGGDPADDPELVQQAEAKIKRAAAAAANSVRSRYIPGEKRFEVVCLSAEEARRLKVGPEFIQCQVEAFSTATRERPESVYIEGEAWRVPVAPDGTLGEPVVAQGYRILDFIRNDNRFGCSVGRTNQQRCREPAPPAPPPPGESAPPGAPGAPEAPVVPTTPPGG